MVTCAPSRSSTAADSWTRSSGMCISASLQPMKTGVSSSEPPYSRRFPGGPINPPEKEGGYGSLYRTPDHARKLSEKGENPMQGSRGAEGLGRSPLAPLQARRTDGLNFTEMDSGHPKSDLHSYDLLVAFHDPVPDLRRQLE